MSCQCSERTRPLTVPAGSNDRPRQWVVLPPRNMSCSAFNGYRWEWSDYSHLYCRVCREGWRSKAAYIDHLADAEGYPERMPEPAEPFDEPVSGRPLGAVAADGSDTSGMHTLPSKGLK